MAHFETFAAEWQIAAGHFPTIATNKRSEIYLRVCFSNHEKVQNLRHGVMTKKKGKRKNVNSPENKKKQKKGKIRWNFLWIFIFFVLDFGRYLRFLVKQTSWKNQKKSKKKKLKGKEKATLPQKPLPLLWTIPQTHKKRYKSM